MIKSPSIIVLTLNEDGGLIGEGVWIQADVGAVVIDQAGTLPTLEGTVIVRRFGGVPWR